jgi:flagellar biogenesis protein FliO
MKAAVKNSMMVVVLALLVTLTQAELSHAEASSANVTKATIDTVGEENAVESTDVMMNEAAPAMDVFQAGTPPEAGMHFPVMRTMGGMGVVLCIMVGLYCAAKKFAPRYFPPKTSDRNMKLLETLGMGDKRSISIIEVGGKHFLVGNTPNQINLIAMLSDSLSLVSEPESAPDRLDEDKLGEFSSPFRNLFEVEKKRSSRHAGNTLPDDIRLKMQQLREALER